MSPFETVFELYSVFILCSRLRSINVTMSRSGFTILQSAFTTYHSTTIDIHSYQSINTLCSKHRNISIIFEYHMAVTKPWVCNCYVADPVSLSSSVCMKGPTVILRPLITAKNRNLRDFYTVMRLHDTTSIESLLHQRIQLTNRLCPRGSEIQDEIFRKNG
jgi:hypothetical protein